jgi:acetyl-CoA carboxylase biotin carboxylase subunit
VTSAVFPAGPGIRVDTHIQAGSAVPPQYDSLLAKLVASGANRAEALGRLRGALARCEIGGVATTLPVHAALADDDEFAAGGVGTDYLARWLELKTRPVRDKNG